MSAALRFVFGWNRSRSRASYEPVRTFVSRRSDGVRLAASAVATWLFVACVGDAPARSASGTSSVSAVAAPSNLPAPPRPLDSPHLIFASSAQPGAPRRLSLAELSAACGEREVEVDDPYHGRRMRYRTLPFVCVLDQGFAAQGGAAGLVGTTLLLRAQDGYTRPAEAALVASAEAHLAFGEVRPDAGPEDPPHFSPIDRRRVDPAPFYLVWSGVSQGDPQAQPWPYQLVRIEIASFEEAFPHTVPRGLASSDPGWQGYALFQSACSACHAINGEGGKVGPDLNVPRSIVEYRPRAQIRAYVRNPQATRYTSMPAHPHFSDAQLDALLAYFEAMRARKHDPGPGGAHP